MDNVVALPTHASKSNTTQGESFTDQRARFLVSLLDLLKAPVNEKLVLLIAELKDAVDADIWPILDMVGSADAEERSKAEPAIRAAIAACHPSEEAPKDPLPEEPSIAIDLRQEATGEAFTLNLRYQRLVDGRIPLKDSAGKPITSIRGFIVGSTNQMTTDPLMGGYVVLREAVSVASMVKKGNTDLWINLSLPAVTFRIDEHAIACNGAAELAALIVLLYKIDQIKLHANLQVHGDALLSRSDVFLGSNRLADGQTEKIGFSTSLMTEAAFATQNLGVIGIFY